MEKKQRNDQRGYGLEIFNSQDPRQVKVPKFMVDIYLLSVYILKPRGRGDLKSEYISNTDQKRLTILFYGK